jgi:hypothetical protein
VSTTTSKTDQTPRTCTCQCGQPTKSKFAVGHDARFASLLRKAFEAHTLTRAQAQKQANDVSPAFSRKVARSLELAAERQAEAKQAAKDKAAAAKPAPAAKPTPTPKPKPPSRARATKAPKPPVTVTDDADDDDDADETEDAA